MTSVTYGCRVPICCDYKGVALNVLLPKELRILDDTIFDNIDTYNNYQGHIIFQGRGMEPIDIQITSARIASYQLKGLHFELACSGVSDELFSGWNTLEYLTLGGSKGVGRMIDYPNNLAAHTNLKGIRLNGYGVFDGGPGFWTFIEEYSDAGKRLDYVY